MGFIREIYSNGNAGLVVSFAQTKTNENFFSGDSAAEAMEYFDLYVDSNNNCIKVKNKDTQALENIGIDASQATEFRAAVNEMLVSLDDETADKNKVLFPLWSGDGVVYSVSERVRYNNVLYKVLQAHTSQSDWNPADAVSLFTTVINVVADDEDSVVEWVQPESTNPYMTGDRVKYNDNIYESLIDNNVWSPSDYPGGWQLIED